MCVCVSVRDWCACVTVSICVCVCVREVSDELGKMGSKEKYMNNQFSAMSGGG